MVCDNCHEREATVHLTEIINGNVSKMHLCEECAKEKGDEMETHFGLSDLLAGLADFGVSQEVAAAKDTKCSSCGFTFSEFKRIGRLGCPRCYETFNAQLTPLMKRIHGADRHMGKLPVKEVMGKLSQEAKELRELKVKLQKAVAVEAFEEAAGLRDRIRDIEMKLRKRSKA